MSVGKLIVLSGPSGVGKSTLCQRLLERDGTLRSVSATTRAPRDGEQDGLDYYFMDEAAFRADMEAGKFVEHAEIYGNLYGTPLGPLQQAVDAGNFPVLDIDAQGAEQLQSLGIHAVYIFVAPPSLEILRERLEGRGKMSPEELETRLTSAKQEMTQMGIYDYVLINDDLDKTYDELVEYLDSQVF